MPGECEEPAEPSWPRTRTFKLLVLATFVLGVLVRVPTFCRPLLSDDEAIYATTADALLRGDLLYRDVVDHKPPLIYHVYQAGFAALGRYNTHGVHALVILSVLLTAGFLFLIEMGTLKGFALPSAPASHPTSPALRAASPNPPAMVRVEQSSPAPHANIDMGTLRGFPNPPAMVRVEQSSPAPHANDAGSGW